MWCGDGGVDGGVGIGVWLGVGRNVCGVVWLGCCGGLLVGEWCGETSCWTN